MAQTTALIDALKNVLKARGVTYAQLAKGLRVSEATVKRTFAIRSFTLQRLDQVCEFLGIEISDLAKMVANESASPARLSREQEKDLVSDPKMLLVAVHALNHWSFDEIVEAYAISRPECIRLLARLDRLGIIDLMPNNRIRVRVTRNFAWLPDGPIQQYFRNQLQTSFFHSRFDAPVELMTFTNGMLSRAANAEIQNKMRRLTAEFSELHHEGLGLPLSDRSGTSLMVALRPWVPDSFTRLRRPKTKQA